MSNYYSATRKINPRGVEDDVLEIFVDTPDIYRLNNLVAEVGTYTFVVWYCSAAECNITFNILGTNETVASTTAWNKFIKTVEYDGTNNNIDITQDLGSTIYLYEAYIAKGSQDKSWSLAPEDWEDGRKERDELIAETMTFAQQAADKFTWLVKSGTNETNFELTSRVASLISEQIDLTGRVTFNSLDSATQDKINNAANPTLAEQTKTFGIELIDRRYEVDSNCSPFIYGTHEVVSATELGGSETDVNLIKTVNYTPLYTDYLPWSFNENPFYCSFEVYYPSTTDGLVYLQVGFFDEDKKAIGSNSGYSMNLVTTRAVTKANTWQTFVFESNNLISSDETDPRKQTKYIRFRYLPRYTSSTETPVTGNAYLRNLTVKQLAPSMMSIIQTDYSRWVSNAIYNGTTTINGGYIKTNTIAGDKLVFDEAFLDKLYALEIDASIIDAGTINANLLNVCGLKVYKQDTLGSDSRPTDTSIETLFIDENGEVAIRGNIESYNYVSGKNGWSIKPDGDAEFNDVTVRGSVIGNYGGIASCGGTGENLQRDTSFANGSISSYWRYGTGYFSVDTSMLYNGVNSVKYTRTGAAADEVVYLYTHIANNVIVPKAGEHYTASAKFYTKNYSTMDGIKPVFGVWFYKLADDGTNTILASERVTIPFVNNQWVDVSVTFECPEGANRVAIVTGAYRNGEFWVAQPKLEQGNVATAWSLSPKDGIKQVIHWAGASYEERESAPWRVYSDGSMVANTGEFGGVFTGEVKIGNISIVDPSSTAGNDALLSIRRGSNGIFVVKLRDGDSSEFAQDIKIVNGNSLKETITLKQDGYGIFAEGVTVKSGNTKSTLSKDNLSLNGSIIDGSTANTIKMLPTTLDVGSVSTRTNLNVYGSTVFKEDVTFESEIMLGSKLKITTLSNGVDIDFIN